MTKIFQVFVDRLKDGQTLSIEEVAKPDFLDIQEDELKFLTPVSIKGKAYLSTDHLILQLSIETEATIPCSICNESFSVPITDQITHAEDLAEIVNHIFDYTELLRETILLKIPSFVECHGGICPERASLSSYLKRPEKIVSQEQVHYPFNNL